MSTRLILKNVPKNADEARVRELFSAKGDVTDVKVMRTKDGRSRCFAFVGFKDKQQASDARNYFDKACIGSCRLEVSFAESYKAEHTAQQSGRAKEHANDEDEKTKSATKGSKRDQLLQEFLGVNKHRSRQQMFANDEANPELEPPVEAAADEGSDATEHNLEDMSDMEYLRSRMGKLDSGAEVRDPAQDMPEAPSPSDDRQHGSDAQAIKLISQTSKLFVRNLPFVTTDDDLLSLMKAYGDIEDVQVVRDKSTGASKGFALVKFQAASDAVAAFQALDGEAFQGRLLHIIPGKLSMQALLPEGSDMETPKQTGFKEERDSKRKASAGDKTAWSTFFMREDTVAQAAADLLGITKTELLDPEAPDAAVRMALAETQIIAATKKELAEAGVSVATLETAARASGHAAAASSLKRSSMVLLVKNLPSEASEDALEELFSKHGTVVRVILPRTKAMAIVEMSDEQGARRAFKRLAYKRFLHVPLYLEYAPDGVLDEAVQRPTGSGSKAQHVSSTPLSDADLVAAATRPGAAAEDAANDITMSTTLYIKNISFVTSRAGLEQHCKKAAKAAGGVLRSVAVPSKKAPSKSKPPGEELLRGFAFAEFGDQQTAESALKRLQGTTLNGHKLQVEFSRKEGGSSQKAGTKRDRDASGTKLMVRNLAFEATSKDVRQLMEAFGQVKTCRIPKKFDGTTRGFAFVEFATKGEAQRAMESAFGTHLYGRRLLLEYAKKEDGVSELRTKAQRVS